MGGMGRPPTSKRQPNRGLAVPLVALPAGGRQEPPPAWPLSDANEQEQAVWSELWTTPQSTQWQRLGWTRAVARYARVLVVGEKRDASAATLAEIRQMEDRLGLTPMAMLRLRWEIATDELAERRAERTTSSRGRVKAVEPRAVAGA